MWKPLALSIGLVAALASPARAEDPGRQWGLSIWGLSYHFNKSIDYEDTNVGLGVRYYFNHLFFLEADALRNSNRGLALPVSFGMDLKVASFAEPCKLYVVGAGTIAYYQNRRTERDYVKVGPVPGVMLGCGRLKTNASIILSPTHKVFSAVVASLTIMF